MQLGRCKHPQTEDINRNCTQVAPLSHSYPLVSFLCFGFGIPFLNKLPYNAPVINSRGPNVLLAAEGALISSSGGHRCLFQCLSIACIWVIWGAYLESSFLNPFLNPSPRDSDTEYLGGTGSLYIKLAPLLVLRHLLSTVWSSLCQVLGEILGAVRGTREKPSPSPNVSPPTYHPPQMLSLLLHPRSHRGVPPFFSHPCQNCSALTYSSPWPPKTSPSPSLTGFTLKCLSPLSSLVHPYYRCSSSSL